MNSPCIFSNFFWIEKRVVGPAGGFNVHVVFYVVLQSHPSVGEIMHLAKGALLHSTVADFLRYNNLL